MEDRHGSGGGSELQRGMEKAKKKTFLKKTRVQTGKKKKKTLTTKR